MEVAQKCPPQRTNVGRYVGKVCNMHTCRYIVPVGVVGVLHGNEKDRVLSLILMYCRALTVQMKSSQPIDTYSQIGHFVVQAFSLGPCSRRRIRVLTSSHPWPWGHLSRLEVSPSQDGDTILLVQMYNFTNSQGRKVKK